MLIDDATALSLSLMPMAGSRPNGRLAGAFWLATPRPRPPQLPHRSAPLVLILQRPAAAPVPHEPRTHVELDLRDLEAGDPRPAATTNYRRTATLSTWCRWLEDEDLHVRDFRGGNNVSIDERPTGVPFDAHDWQPGIVPPLLEVGLVDRFRVVVFPVITEHGT